MFSFVDFRLGLLLAAVVLTARGQGEDDSEYLSFMVFVLSGVGFFFVFFSFFFSEKCVCCEGGLQQPCVGRCVALSACPYKLAADGSRATQALVLVVRRHELNKNQTKQHPETNKAQTRL